MYLEFAKHDDMKMQFWHDQKTFNQDDVDNMHTQRKFAYVYTILSFEIYKYWISGAQEWELTRTCNKTISLPSWHYISMQLSREFITPYT